MEKSNLDKYYTLGETAKLLQVPYKSLKYTVEHQKTKVKFVKVGKLVKAYFRKSLVNKVLKTGDTTLLHKDER